MFVHCKYGEMCSYIKCGKMCPYIVSVENVPVHCECETKCVCTLYVWKYCVRTLKFNC